MKKSTLLAMALTALLSLTTTRLPAHPGGHDFDEQVRPRPDDSPHNNVPVTVPEILQEIETQQKHLAKTVAEKKLSNAHDHAFAIRDLAMSLEAKVSAEKKTKVEAATKVIASIAADIEKSSAAGAQKTTEANVKKFDGVIATLRSAIEGKS